MKFEFMSEGRENGQPTVAPDNNSTIKIEMAENRRAMLWNNRLRVVDDVEAQKQWQTSGHIAERQARAIFDKLAFEDENILPPLLGLPDTDLLIGELARAIVDSHYEPTGEWCEDIKKLRHHKMPDGGEVNIFDILRSAEISASSRLDWWQKEVSGLFEYALENDYVRLRDTEEMIPPIMPAIDDKETVSETDNLPPAEEDELRTSMDEMGEDKEGEPRGYFSVHPFWGGYYRQNIYETYQGGSNWKKAERKFSEPSQTELSTETHIMRGHVRAGKLTPLPLPYGFCPDIASLRTTSDVKIIVDQNGYYYVDARASAVPVTFTVIVGQPKLGTLTGGEAPKHLAVERAIVSVKTRVFLDSLTGSVLEKAALIKKFVQDNLEYSNDSALNSVYENYSDGYFSAVENYKKADCDVANAYYLNLLSATGIYARMVSGHYIKQTGRKGAAVMNSGSRHAWTEVWDDVGKQWMRFDATPKGDPTLDEERPDEKSESEACEQPGDYGEQEAHQLSKEEINAWREQIKQAAKDAEFKTLEQIKDEKFSIEVGCSPAEAASVRAKIEMARNLRDKRGRNIREHLSGEFQQIVESNYKELPISKVPVKRSEGDSMYDKKMIVKDWATGNADPLGYQMEVIELVLAQEYGGIDVYAIADRSGSMAEIDPTTQKSKKDEQQLAIFLILDALYGFSYKTQRASKQNQLISSLSVRSCAIAFQAGSSEIIKPSSSTWKPKEQFSVWKGLESNIGGGTPAHLGLARARAEIEAEIERENKRSAGDVKSKKRLRVVLVFMDGGVDDETTYLAEQMALEKLGVYVSSWGMTESARKTADYPNGHCVASVRHMIEPVCKHIIEKARILKLRQKNT